mmetsp:Transcript_27519/g.110274  ORF Transcript_27519/g.110274 Transcript_27519/m.110274 type:complete len:335 (+) Transcript_27519:707-1711(+)
MLSLDRRPIDRWIHRGASDGRTSASRRDPRALEDARRAAEQARLGRRLARDDVGHALVRALVVDAEPGRLELLEHGVDGEAELRVRALVERPRGGGASRRVGGGGSICRRGGPRRRSPARCCASVEEVVDLDVVVEVLEEAREEAVGVALHGDEAVGADEGAAAEFAEREAEPAVWRERVVGDAEELGDVGERGQRGQRVAHADDEVGGGAVAVGLEGEEVVDDGLEVVDAERQNFAHEGRTRVDADDAVPRTRERHALKPRPAPEVHGERPRRTVVFFLLGRGDDAVVFEEACRDGFVRFAAAADPRVVRREQALVVRLDGRRPHHLLGHGVR